MPNSHDAIDEFTGGAPRADEWRAMREALAERLGALRRTRDSETEPSERAKREREIAALTQQVTTLETEEVVARFVEDSIKASLARAPGEMEGM